MDNLLLVATRISTSEKDLPLFILLGVQCTEVKKGEINYSEILLFQPSLGYF